MDLLSAIRDVVDSFRGGEPSPFSIEQIANVSAVSFAILESAANGGAVAIDTLASVLEDAGELAHSLPGRDAEARWAR